MIRDEFVYVIFSDEYSVPLLDEFVPFSLVT